MLLVSNCEYRYNQNIIYSVTTEPFLDIIYVESKYRTKGELQISRRKLGFYRSMRVNSQKIISFFSWINVKLMRKYIAFKIKTVFT